MKHLKLVLISYLILLPSSLWATSDRICKLALTRLTNSLSISYSIWASQKPNLVSTETALNQGLGSASLYIPERELYRADLESLDLGSGSLRVRVMLGVPGDDEKNHDIKIAPFEDWQTDPTLTRYPLILSRDVPSSILNIEVGELDDQKFSVIVKHKSLFHPTIHGLWQGSSMIGTPLGIEIPTASPEAGRLVGSGSLLREALIFTHVEEGLSPENLRGFKSNSAFMISENSDEYSVRQTPLIQVSAHHESPLAGSFEEVSMFDHSVFINRFPDGEMRQRAKRGIEMIFRKMTGVELNSDDAVDYFVRVFRLRRDLEMGMKTMFVYVVEVHDVSRMTTTSLPIWGVWSNVP